MSKIFKLCKITAVFCAVAMTVTLLAGCGSSSSDNKNSSETSTSSGASKIVEATKLTIIQPDGGRVLKPSSENPPLAELEKATNTKLEITLVPQAEFVNKYTILASSGDIPDISVLQNFGFQQYADQGLFMEIGSLVDQNAPNLKKYITEDEWKLVEYKGKRLAIPYINTAGKFTTVFRQDWLDNLGLSIPTTLDEYKNVIKAFTLNDPDKNGKNDTYGLGAAGGWSDTYFGTDFQGIFGAFGFAANMSYLKDGKVYNSMISDEYRQAIAYIAELWKEKLIDPETFTLKGDQANQKLVQSKGGTVTAWWSLVPQALLNQLKMNEINPNAKWTPLTKAITGTDGKGGYPASGSINKTNAISAESQHAVEAIKFLDYLATDEGWTLSHFGMEGEYYEAFGGPLTEKAQKAFDEKWLDPMSQIVARLDLLKEWNNKATDPIQKRNNVYINACAGMDLYTDVFYGVPPTDEKQTYSPDLFLYQINSFISFVTGHTPLTDATWNEYVKTWKETKKGQLIDESMLKAYNSLYGTNYTLRD